MIASKFCLHQLVAYVSHCVFLVKTGAAWPNCDAVVLFMCLAVTQILKTHIFDVT